MLRTALLSLPDCIMTGPAPILGLLSLRALLCKAAGLNFCPARTWTHQRKIVVAGV